MAVMPSTRSAVPRAWQLRGCVCAKDGVTGRLCGAYAIDTSEDSGATREGKIEWVTLAADPEDVKELLGHRARERSA